MQSLAALGRPGDALTLLRARQSASRSPQEPDQALHEARISLSIRLSCNLLTEAFMEVSSSDILSRLHVMLQFLSCEKCMILRNRLQSEDYHLACSWIWEVLKWEA